MNSSLILKYLMKQLLLRRRLHSENKLAVEDFESFCKKDFDLQLDDLKARAQAAQSAQAHLMLHASLSVACPLIDEQRRPAAEKTKPRKKPRNGKYDSPEVVVRTLEVKLRATSSEEDGEKFDLLFEKDPNVEEEESDEEDEGTQANGPKQYLRIELEDIAQMELSTFEKLEMPPSLEPAPKTKPSKKNKDKETMEEAEFRQQQPVARQQYDLVLEFSAQKAQSVTLRFDSTDTRQKWLLCLSFLKERLQIRYFMDKFGE